MKLLIAPVFRPTHQMNNDYSNAGYDASNSDIWALYGLFLAIVLITGAAYYMTKRK